VVKQIELSYLLNNNLLVLMLGGNHTFKSNASSTYKLWNKPFYILYGDGSNANGTWANDTVNVCYFCFLR
jgi:hypothetical protein